MGQRELVMKTMIKAWEKNYLKLDQVDPKNPLGNKIMKQTMGASAPGYKRHAEMLVKRFDIQDSILEIGCGFGGLALEILKLSPVKYTVIDNTVMLLHAKKYLGDKVEYIEAEKIEILQDRKFELFISENCLAETPHEYREYVLKNITKNCQKICIVDLVEGTKPTTAMLEVGYDMLPLNIEAWLEKYFIIEKTHVHHNAFMYLGERKK